MKNSIQNCIVLVSENLDLTEEVAISFGGNNPKDEDFFIIENKDESFRLANRINKIK